nr:unnamed protein product [Callosobruchus chinensis]
MSYWAKTDDYVDTYFTASVFKPSCTNEGKWKAIQCKGGVNGRCFCFDANGKRLFGEAVVHKLNQMTCACSRRKADLLSQGRSYVSLHCDSLGNYEKLQCDSGLCWCVEPKTGKVTAPVVPMKAMIKLPCYELSQTGSQYYRQCDSVEYALSVISATLRRHGVRYPNIGSIICDGDGAYGAYTVKDGMAHCTSRDGNNISPYASEDSLNFDKLNCNCARDKQRYSYKLSCQTNGNYEYLQSAQSSGYYCVDDDGFAKTEMFNAKVDCSKYY